MSIHEFLEVGCFLVALKANHRCPCGHKSCDVGPRSVRTAGILVCFSDFDWDTVWRWRACERPHCPLTFYYEVSPASPAVHYRHTACRNGKTGFERSEMSRCRIYVASNHYWCIYCIGIAARALHTGHGGNLPSKATVGRTVSIQGHASTREAISDIRELA